VGKIRKKVAGNEIKERKKRERTDDKTNELKECGRKERKRQIYKRNKGKAETEKRTEIRRKSFPHISTVSLH
jgi:hypothetical protein